MQTNCHEHMNYRRYLLLLFVCTLGLLILAVATNYIVDPYNIFGTPRIDGLNAVKPYAGDRGRIAKIYQVMDVKPKALIVGNSRPEIGLDPKHACWPRTAQPVYNIALPGLSVLDQIRYAEHGIAAGDVKIVLIGLDFLDYLNRPNPNVDTHLWPPFAATGRSLVDVTGAPDPGFFRHRLTEMYNALVSLETLTSSVTTVMQQRERYVETRTTPGFNPAEGIYQPIVQHEGVGVLFAQKNQDLARRMTSGPWSLYQGNDLWSRDFEALQRFVTRATGNGIEVIPFINPYHGEYMVLLDLAGLWGQFEDWKRQVVEIMAAAESMVLVWDFGDFGPYATEAVGDLAQTGQSLDWFWEPSHYKRELGDKMLARIFADHCPETVSEDRFGTLLRPTHLAVELTALAAQRDRYMVQNPQIVERLKEIIDRR